MEGLLAELTALVGGFGKSMLGYSDLSDLGVASPSFYPDMPVVVVFSITLFFFNWGVRLGIVEPFVTSTFNMKRSVVTKCAQSVMESLFYGSFSFFGLMIARAQPWVWPSVLWYKGYSDGGHEIMRSDLRCFYLLYIARYVQMSLSVLLEPKRKDFVEMLLHHFVTVVVTIFSYCWGWNRTGVITMVLLDPADVPLHLAKICKYIYDTTKVKIWQTFADRLFELFALGFFVTRLCMYTYVVASVYIEGKVQIPDHGFAGWFVFILLVILLVLQCYWFFLIMKVAVRLLRGSSVEDVRSDDEDDKASLTPKEQTKGHSVLKRAAYSIPVLLVFVRQVVIAFTFSGGVHALRTEVQSLLGGLFTVLFLGSQAATSLPYSLPDLPRDTAVFVVFTIALFTVNWGLRLLLVEPLARSVLHLRRLQLAKYAQSIMEALMYGVFALIGLRVVTVQEWVWPSSQWWVDFSSGSHEMMRSDLRCYYLLYVSRYFQAVLSVLLEAKRKDFVEMILHHVVTVVVIYVSYLYGWNRVGVVVMALLDPADVPLHTAKLCKYTFEATDRHAWQYIADRFFEVFAFVFFVTRLVLYGYVCWSCHIEATRYFPKDLAAWTCVSLLYILLVLQMYWFFLIMKVAAKLWRGQGADDPRSDEEDEDSKKKQ